jgi:hypothetical protein
MVAQSCPLLRQLRVTGNERRRSVIVAPDAYVQQRFLAVIAACQQSLALVELNSAAGAIASVYRPVKDVGQWIAAAVPTATTAPVAEASQDEPLAVSPLFLRLARRSGLKALELADAVIGDATIAGIKTAMAAGVVSNNNNNNNIQPFAHLQRLHVHIDPAAMLELVALVPRIVDLRLKFCTAPAEALTPSQRRCVKAFATVRADHLLALQHLQHLRALSIFAVDDSDADVYLDDSVRVERLGASDWAALAQALAPRLQQLDVGPRFLPREALVVLATQRAPQLERLSVAGKYDIVGLLDGGSAAAGPSFPRLWQLIFGGVAKAALVNT